jgi:hypothetical protein
VHPNFLFQQSYAFTHRPGLPLQDSKFRTTRLSFGAKAAIVRIEIIARSFSASAA